MLSPLLRKDSGVEATELLQSVCTILLPISSIRRSSSSTSLTALGNALAVNFGHPGRCGPAARCGLHLRFPRLTMSSVFSCQALQSILSLPLASLSLAPKALRSLSFLSLPECPGLIPTSPQLPWCSFLQSLRGQPLLIFQVSASISLVHRPSLFYLKCLLHHSLKRVWYFYWIFFVFKNCI